MTESATARPGGLRGLSEELQKRYQAQTIDDKKEGSGMAKLGTQKRPAVLRVQTFERADEIMSLCDSRGWKAIVGVEPQEAEDLTDLNRLLGARTDPVAGRPTTVTRSIARVGT